MGPMDVLTMLGLPEALVNSCRDILEEHAGEMHKRQPPTVSGVFGGSEPGALLDHHTGVAHQHVVDALNDMVLGLQVYAENLSQFSKNLTEQDQQAAADLTPSRKAELAAAGSHLNGTNFHGNRGGDR